MDITVHNAELSVIGQTEVFVLTLELTQKDGSTDHIGWVLPSEVFESRAAEYGLDPVNDWDQLLALVLYENHLGQDPEALLADPDHLFNAPTVAHARKAQLAKIKKWRGTGKIRGLTGPPANRGTLENATALASSGDDIDPLQFIKDNAPISAERIAVRTEYTRRRRNLMRARRAGRNTVDLVDLDAASNQAAADTHRAARPARRHLTGEQLAARLLRPEVIDPNRPPRTAGRDRRAT